MYEQTRCEIGIRWWNFEHHSLIRIHNEGIREAVCALEQFDPSSLFIDPTYKDDKFDRFYCFDNVPNVPNY